MEAMQYIIKAFTKFFFRDVMFVLGGSAIILSFLYVYDRLPSKEPSIGVYALAVGFAYALGYAVQDIFTLFRVVRAKAGVPPNSFAKFLYWLFERRKVEFPNFKNDQYENAKYWLYTDGPQRFRDDHERTESLKQIGTTLGPCVALSGLLLLLLPLLKKYMCFDIVVTLAVLLLGISLFSLGWLKVTQQAQYLLKRAEVGKAAPVDDGSPTKDSI